MPKVKLKILILFVIPLYNIVAQTSNLKNKADIEIGGIGGLGSLNFERVILEKSNVSLQPRIGLSTLRIRDFNGKIRPDLLIPMSFTGSIGKVWKLESGIGNTFSFVRKSQKDRSLLNLSFILGLRIEPKDKKGFFKLSYTPFFDFDSYWRHWGGLSYGRKF